MFVGVLLGVRVGVREGVELGVGVRVTVPVGVLLGVGVRVRVGVELRDAVGEGNGQRLPKVRFTSWPHSSKNVCVPGAGGKVCTQPPCGTSLA